MHNVRPETATLRQQQLAFADAIRHPKKHIAIAGVAPDRMAVYRDLFLNNFIDTLSSAFPVLHKVLAARQWQGLCEHFFAEHTCRTPYLAHLPQAFLTYLQYHPVTDPPWLYELAQWEWTELDLFLAPDVEVVSSGDDVLNLVPRLSPLVRSQHFNYAVQNISVDYLPTAPAPHSTHLLAWRKADDTIGFMQLNTLSARLLDLLADNQQLTGQALLNLVAAEFPEMDSAIILQGGMDALKHFHNNRIIFLSSPNEVTA